MHHRQINPCEHLLDYLSETGSPEERLSFGQHLESCPSCRRELEELKEVWSCMPLDMEEAPVPADLKDQVMGHIFGAEAVQSAPKGRRSTKRWFYSGTVAAAAACGILLFSLGPINFPFGSAGGPAGLAVVKPVPAQVLRTMALRPTDTAKPNCGGTVYHTRKDSVEEVVVQLHGLTPNEGKEAYQVWLIHQGVRHNGGTLVVNDRGEGVLVYRMKEGDPPFEAVGVTLEPDALGTEPRGRKVLGS